MTNTFNLEIKMKEFILALDEILINYPKKEYNLKKIERIAFDLGISDFNGFNADIMIEYYL